jgi:hypothetical protein
MSHGTPIHPFENPMHSVLIIGFGILYFLVATGIKFAASHKDQLPIPVEKVNRLPPIFWSAYGGFGRVGQWIGLAVAGMGFLGLIVSISKKLY